MQYKIIDRFQQINAKHFNRNSPFSVRVLKKSCYFFLFLLVLFCINGCKKLVKIPHPPNSITTSEVFNMPSTATSAVTSIYNDMSFGKNGIRYASGLTTINAGLCADEFGIFGSTNRFLTNNLLPNDGDISNSFWNSAYFDIYMCNAVNEGLLASPTLLKSIKDQLTGEVKFLRAFIYFYLVNLFGDIPLVINTDFATNSLLSRTSSTHTYEQIIADLKDAQDLLSSDYSISGGERTRANKWAAKALMARVYLYTGEWANAEMMATDVINNTSLYDTVPLNKVFLKNSKESILQWQCINQLNFKYATQEGYKFIPENLTRNFDSLTVAQNWQYFVPPYYLTSQLVSAFEAGDNRKLFWTDSTSSLNGTKYYYPFKYKVQKTTPGSINEYYTPLRLAEQYLIRAEARAKQNNLNGAVNDLNVIRKRAGIPNLSNVLTQSQVIAAIAQENRIEFFAEWGHRWLDLKRTGQADAVLGNIKGSNWQTTDQLWPIPQSELITDPNLSQNQGY